MLSLNFAFFFLNSIFGSTLLALRTKILRFKIEVHLFSIFGSRLRGYGYNMKLSNGEPLGGVSDMRDINT